MKEFEQWYEDLMDNFRSGSETFDDHSEGEHDDLFKADVPSDTVTTRNKQGETIVVKLRHRDADTETVHVQYYYKLELIKAATITYQKQKA